VCGDNIGRNDPGRRVSGIARCPESRRLRPRAICLNEIKDSPGRHIRIPAESFGYCTGAQVPRFYGWLLWQGSQGLTENNLAVVYFMSSPQRKRVPLNTIKR